MASAQLNGGASVIVFSGIDPTPTPTNKEAFNGRRGNNKYVYDSMDVLSYLIHIQFVSQNCLLLHLVQ